ncbi:hypothetical protein BT69DRAFT_1290334 [Atractiella rhizophila]|nr:hypothetical protein BT69DRAFT_1290334 [Atractiella rhizophila]
MSTIADLLDRTVLPLDTRLREVPDPTPTASPENFRAELARLHPYHLRHRPRFLEDVCDATERILGHKLASDQLQTSLRVHLRAIARNPVGDESIANTQAFASWRLAVTDTFEEATNLILEFERDPANQGTPTDGRFAVDQETKIQVELKSLRISTNYGDQIVTMGKSDDGYGTNLYHAGDGTEAGARSIVTKGKGCP